MKTRPILQLILLLLFKTNLTVAQNAQWVKQIKSQGFDECLDLATDQSGNVYVTGQIEYIAAFDDGYVLESAGVHDIFLAKFDASGNRLWAKRAGSRLGGEKGHSIGVDAASNVYICGEIDDTSYFDNIQAIGRPANNTFVAKYDPNGNVLWVRHFETDSMNTRGYAIDVDPQGNVYACGATQKNCYYNGNLLLTSRGDYDAYVFKFDTYGNFKWIRQIGGSDSDKAYGVAVSGQDLYVTGYFAGTAQFPQSVTLNGFGGTDFFLAKFDTSGTLQWARQGGGVGFDRGYDVTVNVNGNILCTGEFGGHANFGNTTVNSAGLQDMFLASYDASGNALWAVRGGGPEDDYGRNVTHDNNGNVFVGGDFADTAYFGPNRIISNGYADVYLVSYDSSASSTRFIKSFGGPNNDRGRGVGIDGNGNIYFSGEFDHDITFDSFHITGDTLFDIFIVKFGVQPTCISTVSASAINVSCNGACNGVAMATAAGNAPFVYQWNTSPQQNNGTAVLLCAGSYVVTVTDAVGCQTTATVNLTEPSALSISNAIANNSTCTGCNNGSINLSISGGTLPYTYNWLDGSVSLNRSNLSPGNYSVCIYDNNNCSVCDSYTITEPSTGIGTVEDQSMMNVYPNPLLDNATIQLNSSFDLNEFALKLYTSLGKEIKEIPLSSNIVSVSTGEISSGIYFLKLSKKRNGECIRILPVMIQ